MLHIVYVVHVLADKSDEGDSESEDEDSSSDSAACNDDNSKQQPCSDGAQGSGEDSADMPDIINSVDNVVERPHSPPANCNSASEFCPTDSDGTAKPGNSTDDETTTRTQCDNAASAIGTG